MLFIIVAAENSCISQTSKNNKQISIPMAGNSWVINDLGLNENMISDDGIANWTSSSSVIRTFFYTEKKGTISVAIRARVKAGVSQIECIEGKKGKTVTIKNTIFDTISIGEFTIDHIGYQHIDLSGITRTDSTFAEISDLIIGGISSDDRVYYVKDDFYFGRRGPSVHLNFEIPQEANNIVWFYSELTVPEGNDVLGSYFMANGFADGYFGIQVNSPTERRILFSVWSPYKTDNPSDIPDNYKIRLLKKGSDVITGEFGNEGAGGQSYRRYMWKSGLTYRFLLKGQPSENNSTDYTAYFFAPELNRWQLIASFRRPETNSYLKKMYSFLENFIPDTGPVTREGVYSNQWVCDSAGKWFEVTKVRFTADATARKEYRLDYSGGVENGSFFLRNCGFFNNRTEIGQYFIRPGKGIAPKINFSDFEE